MIVQRKTMPVQSWRNELRATLIQQRRKIPANLRRSLEARIVGQIEDHAGDLAGETLGFYWPIDGEADLRDLAYRLIDQGTAAALPVVVKAGHPLEFRAWLPHSKLRPGVWNIPIPKDRNVVVPTLLFVPLLGFDRAGYRLGYGGGYYDRTVAALSPRPRLIGIGFELSRLPTINPQDHDVPMDMIITEAGAHRYADRPWRPHDSAQTEFDAPMRQQTGGGLA